MTGTAAPPGAPPKPPAPLVSVVIPAYNSAEYIDEAIASVLAQTHRPLEVLVIDDGSRDDTVARARAHGELVTVLSQKNQGSAVARNLGITTARGQYIAFLDADDVWRADKLALQLQALQAGGRQLCYTRFLRWNADPAGRFAPAAQVFAQTDSELIGTTVPQPHIYPELMLDCFVWTSTVLVERQALVDAGLFDTSLRKGQDYDLWLRLSQRIAMQGLDEATALYRQHGSNITGAMMPVNYEYRVLSGALQRWGLKSCDGRLADDTLVQQRLARSSLNHGLGHLQRGDPRIAAESLRLAIGHGVHSPKIALYWLWAVLRSRLGPRAA